VGGYFKPIMEVIWPDWVEEQKEKVRLTLRSSFSKPDRAIISDTSIDDFLTFLLDANLHSFFWNLLSFEEQALRGNSHRIEAMQKDIQAMALVVEHVATELGAVQRDLMPKFAELWASNGTVSALIDPMSDEVKSACLGLQKGQTWEVFKSKLEPLSARGEEGEIAAELLTARFIRGAVHFKMPSTDQFELEKLFVGLMRAAALTFIECKRSGRYKKS
jgi:hypothetical protein